MSSIDNINNSGNRDNNRPNTRSSSNINNTNYNSIDNSNNNNCRRNVRRRISIDDDDDDFDDEIIIRSHSHRRPGGLNSSGLLIDRDGHQDRERRERLQFLSRIRAQFENSRARLENVAQSRNAQLANQINFFNENLFTTGIHIHQDSFPPNRQFGSDIDSVDFRLLDRYNQLGVRPFQSSTNIGLGGAIHPYSKPSEPYKVEYSHPVKYPNFTSNFGPNVRSKKLRDVQSNRQLVMGGEGDKAIYALRCGHVIDGKSLSELIESHTLPKKRKNAKLKYNFKCPVQSCQAEHENEAGLDPIRLWT